MVEMIIFVLLPSFLFLMAVKEKSARLARVTGVLAVVGVMLNRINVSVVAFNWQTDTYIPRWSEVMITLTIITLGVLAFKWVVNRMPVLREHPAYPHED